MHLYKWATFKLQQYPDWCELFNWLTTWQIWLLPIIWITLFFCFNMFIDHHGQILFLQYLIYLLPRRSPIDHKNYDQGCPAST